MLTLALMGKKLSPCGDYCRNWFIIIISVGINKTNLDYRVIDFGITSSYFEHARTNIVSPRCRSTRWSCSLSCRGDHCCYGRNLWTAAVRRDNIRASWHSHTGRLMWAIGLCGKIRIWTARWHIVHSVYHHPVDEFKSGSCVTLK